MPCFSRLVAVRLLEWYGAKLFLSLGILMIYLAPERRAKGVACGSLECKMKTMSGLASFRAFKVVKKVFHFPLNVKNVSMYGLVFNGKRYDIGNKLGFLKTNLIYGLEDPEIGTDLRTWLKSYVREL